VTPKERELLLAVAAVLARDTASWDDTQKLRALAMEVERERCVDSDPVAETTT
jgi:hypothetical protein